MREAQENGDASIFTRAMVQEEDQDGDGLLSLGETKFDEKQFNAIDTDGDGLLSADELTTDLQAKMDEMLDMKGQMTMAMNGMLPPPTSGSAEGSGSGSGSGSEEEEEYDELDLNEDGVVSMSELLQGIRNGTASMEDLLGSLGSLGGGMGGQMSGEMGGFSASYVQRAMNAYAAQDM